jgi:hypothetical protein
MACLYSASGVLPFLLIPPDKTATYSIQKPFCLGRAIPNSIGPGTPGTYHAADGSAWSWIKREEERDTLCGEVSVQVFPFDTWLNGDVAICFRDSKDLIHEGHIDGDAAIGL